MKIPIIVGPTASGKTSISIELAKKINGEIISADSMQIYKYMDIGTAKPTKEEQGDIKHHMLDFVDPNESYNVVKYVIDTNRCIEDILSRKKTPIIVGGTGLYINSILYNIDYSTSDFDQKIRSDLYDILELKGKEELHKILSEIDPLAAENIHSNNVKRVIRAIEINYISKKNLDQVMAESRLRVAKYDFCVFGLNIEREVLYQRINTRVDKMVIDGLFEEVINLFKRGMNKDLTAYQALGYKEIDAYLKGLCTYEECIENIKRDSRKYAKRQLTWFKKNDDINWINVSDFDNSNEIITEIINKLKTMG